MVNVLDYACPGESGTRRLPLRNGSLVLMPGPVPVCSCPSMITSARPTTPAGMAVSVRRGVVCASCTLQRLPCSTVDSALALLLVAGEFDYASSQGAGQAVRRWRPAPRYA